MRKSLILILPALVVTVALVVFASLRSGDRVVQHLGDVIVPWGQVVERDGVEYMVIGNNWETAVPYEKALAGYLAARMGDSTFGPEHFSDDDLPVVIRYRRSDNQPDRIWRVRDGALLWSTP